jgi:hypothetical protein
MVSSALRAQRAPLVALCLCGGLWSDVRGQNVSVPPNYGAAPFSTAAPGFPTGSPSPSATLAPGIQPFDPYALPAGSPVSPFAGSTGLGTPAWPPAPPTTSWPAPGLTNPTAPYPAPSPSMFGSAAPGPAPVTMPPTAPFGAAPPVGSTLGPTPYGGPAQPVSPPPYQRLFEHTGFRYTWVVGNGEGDEMGTSDLEISTTATFANFFGNTGGLRVTPGFVFTWIDGPSAPITADMPSRLYGAYVDFGWYPVFTPQLSAEVNFRPGVFSDFQSVTNDSVRFLGSGIGVIKLGPTSSLKLGAIYIDRADVKLLPAFGVLYTPNQETRWDIFFPSPKLSHYWKTVRNGQLWWYLGGEYGGGSWTMERAEDPQQGASERVDINDLRVFIGTEWNNLNRLYGFLEVGYVFERELYFVVEPSDRTTLADTLMLRAGISF